jgi:hypothetical protein
MVTLGDESQSFESKMFNLFSNVKHIQEMFNPMDAEGTHSHSGFGYNSLSWL